MSSIENMLCIFCKNTTITTTEKNSTFTFNKSEDGNDEQITNLYSICNTCNKYSYIQPGTLLYSEASIKNTNRLTDIKYDPKLIEITGHCTACNTNTIFKQFASSNIDLKYKYICTKCDTFFNTI